MDQSIYHINNIRETNEGVVEIHGEIPPAKLASYLQKALEKFRSDLAVPGFRKGRAPDDIVKREVGEAAILEEAARIALQDTAPRLLAERKVAPLAPPRIQITRLAPKQPVAFVVQIFTAPPLQLPDYRRIARTVLEQQPSTEVTDEEVTQALTTLTKLYLSKTASSSKTADEPKLPTDEIAQKMGSFKNVNDLREKVRQHLQQEKREGIKRQLRERIAAALIEATTITLPEALIDEETEKTERDFEKYLKQSGTSLAEYLAHTKKTAEQVRQEHRDYVIRQLKARLIFEKIAEREHITVDDEEVAASAKLLQQRNPNQDPELIRSYVRKVLTNEKVLQLLEQEKPDEKPE